MALATPPPQPAGHHDELGTSTTVELAVEGMHCASCVLLIEETLARDPAVHRATVDLAAARASVTFDPGAASVDTVCATVTGLGYRASPAPAVSPGS